MTDLSYMFWFLATAAMTITVLAVGTLAAAELLPGRRRARSHSRPHSRPRTGPADVHDSQKTLTGGEHHDHEHQAA